MDNFKNQDPDNSFGYLELKEWKFGIAPMPINGSLDQWLFPKGIMLRFSFTIFLGRPRPKVTITARASILQKILHSFDKKVGCAVEGYTLQNILHFFDEKVGCVVEEYILQNILHSFDKKVGCVVEGYILQKFLHS